MNRHEDIERILKKLVREKPEEMENIDDIDNFVFDRIEAKALSDIIKRNQVKKRRLRIYLRASAVAIAVIAVFSLTLYLVDLPSTRAAKEQANEVNLENDLPQGSTQSLNIPKYVPEGYSLDNIEFVETEVAYSAEFKYLNPSDESLYILIRIEGEQVKIPKEYEKVIHDLEFRDMPLVLTTVYSEPIVNHVNFFDNKGFLVQIAATVDEDTLLKIMNSMD